MILVQCISGCTKPVPMPLPPAGYPPIWPAQTGITATTAATTTQSRK